VSDNLEKSSVHRSDMDEILTISFSSASVTSLMLFNGISGHLSLSNFCRRSTSTIAVFVFFFAFLVGESPIYCIDE
jgi:hypothetical protein